MTNISKEIQEDVINILRNSDNMLREFKTRIKNKYVIIFVGDTRNGKSTLVSYIVNTPLVAIKSGDLFKIEHEHGDNIKAPIAHGSLSHTTVPNVIEINGRPDTIIVDAPGFDDNRGVQQEIINALYINQVKYSKGVRFVLVSDINNVINDNINSFLRFIETVHTIMPEFIKLREAVSIIFTKDRQDYDVADIVDILKKKILNQEGLQCKKDLIKHFVNRKDLIGLFKMPTEPGPLRNEINVNVNEAIFGSSPVDLSENDIKFGISKRALVVLLEIYLDFFDLVIGLQKTLEEFRRLSFNKFPSFRLLSLSAEILRNVREILQEFNEKIIHENTISPMEIPSALNKLFIMELNKTITSLKRLGIEFPEDDADPNFYSNKINGIQQQLEYIACIEKVVEKDIKSRNVFDSYKKNVVAFIKDIEKVQSDVDEELAIRDELASKIDYILNSKDIFYTIDEKYLSASNVDELKNMKDDLLIFIEVSDEVKADISKRPSLEQLLVTKIFNAMSVYNVIQIKLESIDKHMERRRIEMFLPNIPAPVKGILAFAILYGAGKMMTSNLPDYTKLNIAAGTLLLFTVVSCKSAKVNTYLGRCYQRYLQKRLLTNRTKLYKCWEPLVL